MSSEVWQLIELVVCVYVWCFLPFKNCTDTWKSTLFGLSTLIWSVDFFLSVLLHLPAQIWVPNKLSTVSELFSVNFMICHKKGVHLLAFVVSLRLHYCEYCLKMFFVSFSTYNGWHLLKPIIITQTPILLGIWWGSAIVHPRDWPQNRAWVASVFTRDIGQGPWGKGRAAAASQGTHQTARSKHCHLLYGCFCTFSNPECS